MCTMEEKQDFVSFILENNPWTYSKIRLFLEKPNDFIEQMKNKSFYISNHTRNELGYDVENAHMIPGTVIHKFLEDVFKKRNKINDFYSYVSNLKIPESLKNKVLEKNDSVKKCFELLCKDIKKQKEQRGETRLSSEMFLSFKVSVAFAGSGKKTSGTTDSRPDSKQLIYSLRGVLDLVIYNDNTITVYDYKNSIDKKNLGSYIDQMGLYLVLLSLKFPQAKVFRLNLMDLKRAQVTTTYVVPNDQLEDQVTKVMQKINSKLFEGYRRCYKRIIKEK